LLESEPVQEALDNPKLFVGGVLYRALNFMRRESLVVRLPSEKEVERLLEKIKKAREDEAKKLEKLTRRR
jgi:hypothetical protein